MFFLSWPLLAALSTLCAAEAPRPATFDVSGSFTAATCLGDRALEADSIFTALLRRGAGQPHRAALAWKGKIHLGIVPHLTISLPAHTLTQAWGAPANGWAVLADGVPVGHLPPQAGVYRLRLAPQSGCTPWRIEPNDSGFTLHTQLVLWPNDDPADAGAPAAQETPALDFGLTFDHEEIQDEIQEQLAELLSLRLCARRTVGRIGFAIGTTIVHLVAGTMTDRLCPEVEADCPLGDMEDVAWAATVPLDIPLRWLTPPLIRQLDDLRAEQRALVDVAFSLQRAWDAALVLTGFSLSQDVQEAAAILEHVLQEADMQALGHPL